ncbi:hypothetical protein Trydic_g19349 [Trypoxylus dichotomus]
MENLPAYLSVGRILLSKVLHAPQPTANCPYRTHKELDVESADRLVLVSRRPIRMRVGFYEPTAWQQPSKSAGTINVNLGKRYAPILPSSSNTGYPT